MSFAFAGIDGVMFYWETTFEAELLCIVTDGCTFPADCTINLHVQLHSPLQAFEMKKKKKKKPWKYYV